MLRVFSSIQTRTLAENLALCLQPVLRERAAVCSDTALTAQKRLESLARLDRQARQVGLEQFNRELASACRVYFTRKKPQAGPRFELDIFTEEVLVLTHARLMHFDPQKGRFSTWLGSHILLRVYTDLQRSIDPTWRRPQPITPEGQLERRNAHQLTHALSLDRPVGTTDLGGNEELGLLDTLSASGAPVESGLLEEQCRVRFVWALAQLSDHQKALLTRVYIHGEAQKDIARSLGVAPARVCQKLRDICKQLAVLLGEDFREDCGESEFCEALRWSSS